MNPGEPIAVVVYFGRARGIPWWARLFRLRPDFTHCGIMLRTDISWIALDPLAHWMQIGWAGQWELDGFTMAERLVYDRGFTAAVFAFIRPPAQEFRFPWPATCVEIVKRALGHRFGFVFTPRQLFRFLARHPDTAGVFHDADADWPARPDPRDSAELAD